MMNNEKFRNSVLAKAKMVCGFTSEQLMMLENILIEEMRGFTLKQEETQLMVRDNENEKLLNVFLVRKEFVNLSKGSISNYKGFLGKFIADTPKPLKDVTTDDLRIYLSLYKKERGVSDRTADNYRLTFSSFFGFLHDNGYIPTNPTAALEPIKYKAKCREFLTRLEVEKIRRKITDIREEAMFEMFYSTGCRVSEIADMNLSDINFDNNSIKVCGKGDKERIVLLTDKAKLALLDYLTVREDRNEDGTLASDAVFVNSKGKHARLGKSTYESMIKAMAARAGIKRNVTPHVLRHTFATHLLETTTIDVVQALLGHVKADTTKIYAKISMNKIQHDFNLAVL